MTSSITFVRTPAAAAWSRVVVLAVSPPSDSRTIARSRASAVNCEVAKATASYSAVSPAAVSSATRDASRARSVVGPARSEGCDPKPTTPTRTSGGSTSRNSAAAARAASIGAPTMLPDVSTTSMISRFDVGTRSTVASTGSPSSVTSKADAG